MLTFATAPIADLFLALVWAANVLLAWRSVVPPCKPDSVEERTLGASVIIGQLNAVITGASIIVAGIGAFVALGWDRIAEPVNYHLLYASIWAVGGIGLSLYTMGMLPSRSAKVNFVRESQVAFMSAMALFFSLAAGVRLVFAIWGMLLPGNV